MQNLKLHPKMSRWGSRPGGAATAPPRTPPSTAWSLLAMLATRRAPSQRTSRKPIFHHDPLHPSTPHPAHPTPPLFHHLTLQPQPPERRRHIPSTTAKRPDLVILWTMHRITTQPFPNQPHPNPSPHHEEIHEPHEPPPSMTSPSPTTALQSLQRSHRPSRQQQTTHFRSLT